MIHFLLGVYEAVARQKPCNILIIGRDGVGKTTLFEQMKHMCGKGHAPQTPCEQAVSRKTIRPTVGLNVALLNILGHEVKVMDLGGQQSLRSLWPSYFGSASGIIFVTDATATRAQLVEDHELLRRIFVCKALAGAPIAILANKRDAAHGSTVLESVQDGLGLLDLALGAVGVVEEDAARALDSASGAGGKMFKLFEVSARRGDGVEAALRWVVEQSVASSRWDTLLDGDT